MFSFAVERWLKSNSSPRYQQFLDESRSTTAALLRDAGIASDCELAHFYLHYGPGTCRGWYELNEADEIADATQYARDEFGVPAGYIALTGYEGEGVVLYELQTGEVYDVELGRLDDFLSGSMAPIATRFEGFLIWCMNLEQQGS
jgi:hypothetical protein